MEAGPKLRLDKWLWQARFCKSRALADELASSGRVRLNGAHVSKPATGVRPGDVLTFPLGRAVRVIRVEALGVRRGPATEAQALYTDLAPPAPSVAPAPGDRSPGSGRPTKRARREIDRLRDASS